MEDAGDDLKDLEQLKHSSNFPSNIYIYIFKKLSFSFLALLLLAHVHGAHGLDRLGVVGGVVGTIDLKQSNMK